MVFHRFRRLRGEASPDRPAVLRCEAGSVAIEMALVALPFFMLIFGMAAIGLYFLTSFMLERGVDQTGRLIRTCAYKSANGGAGLTTLQLKEAVCESAPGFVSCGSKLRVALTTPASFAAVGSSAMSAADCVDGSGNLVTETANNVAKVGVAANAIAVLTACYQYELGNAIPFLDLGSVSGGNGLFIKAATAFKVEPCE